MMKWRMWDGQGSSASLPVCSKELRRKDSKKVTYSELMEITCLREGKEVDNNTEKTVPNYAPSIIICCGFTLCTTIEEAAKSSATEGSSPENVLEDPDKDHTVVYMHIMLKPVVFHLWVTGPLHPWLPEPWWIQQEIFKRFGGSKEESRDPITVSQAKMAKKGVVLRPLNQKKEHCQDVGGQ